MAKVKVKQAERESHLYRVYPSRPTDALGLCLDCCIDSFELGDAKEIHKLLLPPKRPAKCAGKLQKSVEDIERWMRMKNEGKKRRNGKKEGVAWMADASVGLSWVTIGTSAYPKKERDLLSAE